ncbi:MAG: hypothetical protein K8S24_00800, partial [Candidatus Aegiribacteria sp.]|nr:hypothetical protein [Candidatus Aegiribacteria sp.]
MTNKKVIPVRVLTALILLLSFFFVISCGGEPEEGEIVIRVEDIFPDDEYLAADTLFPADTVVFSDPDTLFSPDSVVTLIPDFPASDTTTAVEPDECPWERIALQINGSIYASLSDKVDEPDILGAHIVRCMW